MRRPWLPLVFASCLEAVLPSTRSAPITVIGGFLGSGKTTTLRTMLTNRAGLKIAICVNDLASVNVDAGTLRRASSEEDGVETIELDNGCVCCGAGAVGLAPTLRRLRSQDFDHLVVELSGVADPASVKANLRGAGLAVDRTVALVDATSFIHNFESTDGAYQRPEMIAEIFESRAQCSVDQPVVELLLRQLETADLLLVNKADLASAGELSDTLDTCRAINQDAAVVAAQFGEVALDALLPPLTMAPSFTMPSSSTAAAAGHLAPPRRIGPRRRPPDDDGRADLETSGSAADVSTPLSAHGFSSFVYRARQPFVGERLRALIADWRLPRTFFVDRLDEEVEASVSSTEAAGEVASPFAGVLRSKGVAWLDTHHEQLVTWSNAGRHISIEAEQCWWAMLADSEMLAVLERNGGPHGAEEYEAERGAFDGEFGDRRQELVFIGTGLDPEAIGAALDACLATQDEMREYRERWSGSEPSMEAWADKEYLRR